MSSRLVIAHLSDLHLSAFGERVSFGAVMRGELPRPAFLSRAPWEDVEAIEGWRIQRQARHGLVLRLVDPAGVRHDRAVIPPGRGHSDSTDRMIAQMRGLAQVRSRSSLSELTTRPIDKQERARLLAIDPINTNLRFVEAIESVRAVGPDVIVVSGDLTDDGVGYELVASVLGDYISAGRLVAVAGNHDLGAVPPGTIHNMGLRDKQVRWEAFRNGAHLAPEREGASSTVIDDVLFLGLNSSVRPSRLAFDGRGRVGKLQLSVAARLIDEAGSPRARICCVHHHVAHLRLGPIAPTDPVQFALKLRDAKEVVELLRSRNFSAVLNGHRHHGYYLAKAEIPNVVSAPSTTLGCRASQSRYFWLLTVDDRSLRVDQHAIDAVSLPAVAP